MNIVKINNVAVKFVKGAHSRFKIKYVIPVMMRVGEGWVDDKKMRRACVRVLKTASLRGAKTIVLLVSGTGSVDFPAVAAAKVVAQEVFRHLREERHSFKEIFLMLDSGRHFQEFKKTAAGYLNHMLYKICQGPFVTVDAIIEINGGVVLIERSNPPFGWAIPGGFVDYGESLEEAVAREAMEETGLVVKNLRQMHTYSDPRRDPRFHTVSTVFIGRAKGWPKAGSDAQKAKVFKPHEWEKIELVFDHRKVLLDYLEHKKCPHTLLP